MSTTNENTRNNNDALGYGLFAFLVMGGLIATAPIIGNLIKGNPIPVHIQFLGFLVIAVVFGGGLCMLILSKEVPK